MFKKGKALFLVAETSVHAGSGTDLGIVDLPIQRESHTGYPKIESSGIKGGIREQFKSKVGKENIKTNLYDKMNFNESIIAFDKFYNQVYLDSFGPEPTEKDKEKEKAGTLTFTDARILFFPVKSLKGIYAYVTCPDVLERFKREMDLVNIKDSLPSKISGINVPTNKILCSENNTLEIGQNKIVLEEFAFDTDKRENETIKNLGEWFAKSCISQEYWKEKIKKDIVIVSNDTFKHLVENYTEVNARIRIDPNTGVVAQGQLWYEEYLPFDTIMYSLVFSSPAFKKHRDNKIYDKLNGYAEEDFFLSFLEYGLPAVINLGGNTTIGKGILRTKIFGGK